MLMVLLAMGVVTLDQWTKEMVRLRFSLGESIAVIPDWVHLTYVRNTGAAWGLFGGYNHWLVLFSLVMLAILLFWRHSIHAGRAAGRWALGLMLGGIVGNLLDRVCHGYVIDFLDFQFWGWHFPAFNVADSAITVGVCIYLISTFREDRCTQTQGSPGAVG